VTVHEYIIPHVLVTSDEVFLGAETSKEYNICC